MSTKYVYLFSEGNKDMRGLLGGKGANLAEMMNVGMPVPQGFTITTEACTRYYEDGRTISADIENEIFEYIKKLEELTGKQFGSVQNPLLVSVRSGSRASMPGMMDTILNLGLNDEVVEALAEKTGNPRFAYDSYRRFIQMFSDVVMEQPKAEYEKIIDELKEKKGVKQDTELNAEDLKWLVGEFKARYEKNQGEGFPAQPKEQLIQAVQAVFRSWDNPRANAYRHMNEIPYDWGTAVNVQSMVFGNSGENSGTGVAFTRNPATGEKALFGEYLINAQGEDVVAGIRTPSPISHLKKQMPGVYKQFKEIADRLENHYKDMQDMEFTIEDGKLYMLQTRTGKRTAAAALKVAVDLVDEGMISVKEAIMRVEPIQLDSLLHPQFEKAALKSAKSICKGLAASPGAAAGQIVFAAEDAAAWHEEGKKVILVRLETSPEDIEGMAVAQGILTARGGMTSHAAVVARGMGTCCVCGVSELVVDYDKKQFSINGKVYKEGDFISLNGSTGKVYGENLPTVKASISGDFERFMGWADEIRDMEVYCNAETPKDVQQGSDFGSQGIGLCRTEHMFFDSQRIKAMREMILSKTVEGRKKALEKIRPYQQGDFESIFEIMGERPVVIRYLDPPLHEFLPTKEEDIVELASELGISVVEVRQVMDSLHEFNPMMGHRGVRLAISYPEIVQMQTEAVIQAALNVSKRTGKNIVPQIMIPLVGGITEFKYVKKYVVQAANGLIEKAGSDMKYEVGTMIELPRAALVANEIATEADFFSFGTNDLTQMTFGFSRDDASKFLNYYYKNNLFDSNPFAHIDQKGVGKLVKTACELGRGAKSTLHLGICGEHGGDPTSVEFFHNAGLDYVSCSPFRVPVARLAAAQATIKNPR